MVVQHNLQAMNSNRMLNITQGSLSKSTEKLSSGYKINRAADDAAGLAISEKMRKQINGLTQASSNAQDGISCVQTAEGALAEVEDMLQRMNQLSVQASNGTNSKDDRQNIQDEIDQLVTEIDRVAETSKFNETYLLKGDPEGGKQSVGQYTYKTGGNNVIVGVTLAANAAGSFFTLDEDGTRKYITAANVDEFMKVTNDGQDVTIQTGKTVYKEVDGVATTLDAASYGDLAAVESSSNITLYDADGNRISENGLAKIMKQDNAHQKLYLETGQSLSDIGVTMKGVVDGYISVTQAEFADDLKLTFHVGSEGAASNKISIDIESMDSVNLGVNILSSNKNGIVDEDGQSATDAIGVIADAIAKVSKQRSGLGAIQNRLEHTIKNLDNIAENTSSAESAIRDTDMATEMVKYSNANILAQAGQSMLAQANQSNQGVLSLLG